MKHAACFVLLVVFLALLPLRSDAHKLQPAYLEISEQGEGKYSLLWKRPLVGGTPMQVAPQLPTVCSDLTPHARQQSASGSIERWMVDCGSAGLVSQQISIQGLSSTQTDVLLRLELADGIYHTAVLRPDSVSFLVPEKPSRFSVSGSYLVLGVEHILGGVDHLLFVLGLLLIVRGRSLLVKTITAFTIAHSLTLALAVLGFVRVPQAPVEAVIALSILFLAVELCKQYRGTLGLTARSPWVVALCFGLLHGFGFAGALTEVGLPAADISLALLFFNLGVEIGQILFVVVVLFFIRQLQRIRSQWPGWAMQVPSYAIGSLAAFWFIERTVSLW